MISDLVKSEIRKHEYLYGIIFSEDDINNIIKYVSEGVYAFNLIYDDYNHCVKIKKLNWNLVKSKDVLKTTLKIWSYDGGLTYKYNEIETFLIDLRLIRELKLNSLYL